MQDFFISYTGNDRTWAEWIAWVLEESGYSVVIQAWDFRVGGNFVLDMQTATAANRTIAVLSKLYLQKPFPQSEWAAAFAQDPTSANRKLIPIRVEDCNPSGLLSSVVHVDVFNCDETEAQQRLLAAVKDGRMKPAQCPPFPGKGVERQVPEQVPFPGTLDLAEPSPASAFSKIQSTPDETLTPETLNSMLERVSRGEQTEADRAALQQLLNTDSGKTIVQSGKYNVSIGQGQEIHIGDRTYTGTDADTIRAIVRAMVQELQPKSSPASSTKSAASQSELSLGQRRRLEQKRGTLQSEWDLRSEKAKRLRAALAIETGAAIRFQLEQQLQDEDNQLTRLEAELDQLDELCESQ